MQILEQKPGTKRPVIIRAATSLFSQRGVDATSMRHIADASGIREAAIYRHFASKEELSREIFVSWYGWYSGNVCEIVRGPGSISEKLRRVAAVELATAEELQMRFCILRKRAEISPLALSGCTESPHRSLNID